MKANNEENVYEIKYIDWHRHNLQPFTQLVLFFC